MTLQDNALTALPTSFFINTEKYANNLISSTQYDDIQDDVQHILRNNIFLKIKARNININNRNNNIFLDIYVLLKEERKEKLVFYFKTIIIPFYRMKVLNLSNNRLSELPHFGEGNKNRHNNHSLEKLYLTANCLTDTALDALVKFTSLRVLHIAYNTLDTLSERYRIYEHSLLF